MKRYKVAKIDELLKGVEKGILSNQHLFLSNQFLIGKILPASFAVYRRAGGEFVWEGYKFSYIPELGGWEIAKIKA